ncbi:MAG: family 43 glycosylhydrolase [Sporolactobacillus sp.]|nr:family 43 glycosylhydrolase [Sporolactobacillus sp.]
MTDELINGTLWQDTAGRPIHARGGCIIAYHHYYYWYGEDRRDNNYVSCYRSADLFNWEFRNCILTTDSPSAPIRQRTTIRLRRDDGGKVNLERPKVLYNEATGRFVLWVHYENGVNYREAACAVATCDQPDGDFVYHGHFNPYGYMSRDCTLYRDQDGSAYFISTARDNADLNVYRLQEDYLNVGQLIARLWPGEYREAPALIKKGGIYYLLSSYCTGWAPNQGKYGTAADIGGPWSRLVDFADATTYRSQPAFILDTAEYGPLYFGDRWDGEHYTHSSYVLLPIKFSGRQLSIDYYRKAVRTEASGIQFIR